jgi:hypothetical protein
MITHLTEFLEDVKFAFAEVGEAVYKISILGVEKHRA